ncbi:MAG: ABC transporter permease subunit [Myxococcales bacterium]|nr:ABC transporter permease subunit [Myxococcales bacterium]
MIGYLAKRLLAMVPTLLGITVITFVVISLAPGDPVDVPTQIGGVGDGSDQAARERAADSIKAKKQLLGLLEEDHSALSFPLGSEMPPSRALALSSWGRRIALREGKRIVASADGVFVVMDTHGVELHRVQAHEGPIFALAVAHDGRIATADGHGAVSVHRWGGSLVSRTPGTGKPTRDLAFGAKYLFAVDDGGSVRQIEPASGRLIRQRADAHGGGAYAVATSEGRLYTGGADRRVLVMDPGDLHVTSEIKGFGGAINDIEVAGRYVAIASDDGVARVLLGGGSGEFLATIHHAKRLTAVALTAQSKLLYTGGDDEVIRAFHWKNSEFLGAASQKAGRVSDLVVEGNHVLAVGEFWRKVPIPTQYLTWLGRILTLDFGRSFVDDEPVMDKIARALPITLGLNVLAILIIYGVSIPVGILAAVRRGRAFDNVSSLLVFVLYSVPNFWLATMLIMLFSSSRALDVFPSGKLQSDNPWDLSYLAWLGDIGWHLVLPVTVMVYAGFASLSRYVRTSMLESLSQDFVRTARAKGLRETAVVLQHAFRNALITIITLVGNLLPRMIGGSVIVEYIFSIDGMGRLGFDAILSRDYPVIMAITTFAAVLTLLGILLSDVLYGVANPRVRVAEDAD